MKFSLLVLLIATPLSAQTLHWQPTNGPYGAAWWYVFAHDSTVFVGNPAFSPPGMFYRSSDDGATWVPLQDSLINSGVLCFASYGKVILAGTDIGIYRSTDEGVNWHAADTGLGEFRYTTAFATTDSEIFASAGDSIYRSIDSGASWSYVGCYSVAPWETAYSMLIKDSTILVTDGILYQSNDKGRTWKVNPILFEDDPHGMELIDNLLYCEGYVKGINSILRWDIRDTFASVMAQGNFLCQNFACLGSVFFTGGNKVYRVSNNGFTWKEADAGLPTAVQCFATKGTKIFAATNVGLYFSTDSGSTWKPQAVVPVKASVQSVAAGNTFYALSNGGMVFYSTDEGGDWSPSNIIIPSSFNVEGLTARGSNVLVDYGTETLESDDSGLAWIPVLKEGSAATYMDGICLAGIENKLLRSVDSTGRYWYAPSDVFLSSDSAYFVTAFCQDGKSLLALLQGYYTPQQLYRSTDEGFTWNLISDDIDSEFVFFGLAAGNGTIYISASNGLLESTDEGITWAITNYPKTRWNQGDIAGTVCASGNVAVFSSIMVEVDDQSNLIGYDTIITFSTNSGSSWIRADSGLNHAFVQSLTIKGTTIIAGTDQGVYKGEISDYLTVANHDHTAGVASLSVYPNPAHSAVTIAYDPDLVKSGIKVYNTLGEQVINVPLNALGETRLTVSNLPPGIYEFVLHTGAKTSTRKVIIER